MNSVASRVLSLRSSIISKTCSLLLRSDVQLKRSSLRYPARRISCGCAARQLKTQAADSLEQSSWPVKRVYKRRALQELPQRDGQFVALAFATAESYDLNAIREALQQQKLYEPGKLMGQDTPDVVHASAVYQVGSEPREIFIFKEGAVVFWNCTDLEATNMLEFLKRFEIDSYPEHVVYREREIMPYTYGHSKKCYLSLSESMFVLVAGAECTLERYTFSNAMAQSAKLGAWEARLDSVARAVHAVSTAMERTPTSTSTGAVALSRDEVVRRLGELFSLRHRITVQSDLLDTPDFYWEQEQLERLYHATTAYFTIARRTRVLTERVSHCIELTELLSTWASDRHHVRLEWMIIALILVEVLFETLHFLDRYRSPGSATAAAVTSPPAPHMPAVLAET